MNKGSQGKIPSNVARHVESRRLKKAGEVEIDTFKPSDLANDPGDLRTEGRGPEAIPWKVKERGVGSTACRLETRGPFRGGVRKGVK